MDPVRAVEVSHTGDNQELALEVSWQGIVLIKTMSSLHYEKEKAVSKLSKKSRYWVLSFEFER
ncbi:MAG: hypothetical protein KAT15_13930 [Bacteroidales bacterium]|nr:hypothetical protein [Bacteroidales bacterium]